MTQVFKIQVLVAGDKFITLNMEGVYQKVQKVMRHTTVVDETADVTDLTFLHFLLELSNKVGTAGGVVNQYVSVTGDFDAVAGINIVAGENKVEVCLDYIFGKHQVMVFLAGWKFDEAGHFGVGLLHHEVKRLPGFCQTGSSFISFFLRIDSYGQVKAVIPQEGDYFIFGYRHRLQVGKNFFPEKVFNKLLVERFYMSVLIKDDVILAQGR